jgi:uncharacterized protein YndB with AHSA1/START domain
MAIKKSVKKAPLKDTKSAKEKKAEKDITTKATAVDKNADTGEVKPKKAKRRKKKKQVEEEFIDNESDMLLNKIIQSTKRRKKASKKVPKQIRTFTNPSAELHVQDTKSTKKAKKEPKGKFEIEYVIGTSPAILYEFVTTPSGLSEWFADDVNIKDGVFTFFWDGSEQKAQLLAFKKDKSIRFQWLDKPEGTYFEFRIEKDDLTGDISFMVVDFAEEGTDFDTSKLLWDSQVQELMNVIGSY